MGRAPAYVFVVRHGNRLDAANKQWHLQSPTPYDPPLTYSGWNQARATGQRIGEILREKEAQDEAANAAGGGPPTKKRKFKIVIHSSPFLRCVQTSIGISAGLAAMPEPTGPVPARASSTHTLTNPRLRPSISVEIPPAVAGPSSHSFSDLPTPPDGDDGPSRPTTPKEHCIEKTVLRLDAFLGEWLTPGYFELITPPPGSSLMLASAKARLLRKEDYSNNPNFAAYNNAAAGAQTWGQSPSPLTPASSLDNVSSLAEALRRTGRSASITSVTSNGESRLSTGGAYVAPVPAYAISHNAEIPNGYVPHARDNCCQVDYQWDSMRGTLDWGDGGKLGEEWTSMHARFRRGLQKLVDWYTTADNPTQMVTRVRRPSVDDYVVVDDEEDVEIESVVIIVSHGAGCNALIGAITHQPVLTDVGLASLTEAVRKPEVKDIEDDGLLRVTSNGSDTVPESPGRVVAIHEYYDLKLFASSEHLSSGRRLSRTPSVTAAPKPPSRGRLGSTNFASSPLSGTANNNGLFSLNSNSESRASSGTMSFGGTQRESGISGRLARLGLSTSGMGGGGITVGSGVTSFLSKQPAGGGLWSPVASTLDTPDEEEDDFLPNFSSFDTGLSASVVNKSEDSAKAILGPAFEPASIPPKADNNSFQARGNNTVSPRSNAISDYGPIVPAHYNEERDSVRPLRQALGQSAGGLWGSPKPIEEEEISRDFGSTKRRWTVNERY